MITQGVDSNLNVIPLLLDASGNVIVSASQLTTTGGKIKVDSSGRLTITADEPHYINPVGSMQSVLVTNMPAGSSVQTVYTIPSNQRHILTGFMVIYVGTVAGLVMQPQVSDGANIFNLDNISPVTNGKYYIYFPDITLEAGWSARVAFAGATLNDDFQGVIVLRRIK